MHTFFFSLNVDLVKLKISVKDCARQRHGAKRKRLKVEIINNNSTLLAISKCTPL